MTLVLGTKGNDTKTFNPGDSYSLSTGTDTLVFNTTDADLTSTTLTSVEILKAGLSSDTTFTVDQADMASGGSIVGSTGSDTLIIHGTSLNLTSTVLDSIEAITAGSSLGTTFTVDGADLLSGGSVTGSTGTDTLAIKSAAINLTSTTLTSVEKLQASLATATVFTVDAADLAAGGSVVGGKGSDTLTVTDTAIDLTSTTLTSIEKLAAGSGTDTVFTVDQADLASKGSVAGSSGVDSLVINGTALNLTSTTLTSVENLQAGSSLATTFTVDPADLASGGSITGSSGDDKLVVKGTALNLTSTTLTSVEIIAGSGAATTFTVDQNDLASGGSVLGSSGSDALVVKDAAIDLTSTTLTSIEALKAGLSTATTFTVDAADLAIGGSVVGSSGSDTLIVNNAIINLTSTTLTSIEAIQTGVSTATLFTVDAADLAGGGSIVGSSGVDTLVVKGTALNLSSTSVDSIEILKAGASQATTFTVDADDLVSGGSIIGSSGNDTLAFKGTVADLSSTSLTSIEILKAGSSLGTAFTVDVADLSAGGSVVGSSGNDSLTVIDTSIDLTSTTLTSIEKLAAGSASDTTFRVDQADLAANGTVAGSSGADTLIVKGTSLNLSSTNLDSLETLKAGSSLATTFTVDTGDMNSVTDILGSSGSDTIVFKGAAFDLTSAALTSIEKLQAGNATATVFMVDAADLASGGSVVGSSGSDTLTVFDTAIDLTSTTLTSIEKLAAGSTSDSFFTVNVADLASGGSVAGNAGSDTLSVVGTSANLTSTTLNSVEILQGSSSLATTFTVDQADLDVLDQVIGSTGVDTLITKNSTMNLAGTTLTSIEKLQGSLAATVFTLDNNDLAAGGSVLGGKGVDTVAAGSGALDLTSTTLTSIEKLAAGTSNATTFTVDAVDLVAGGSVVGSSGSDTLEIGGTTFNLTSTTLSSVEILKAGSASDTTFTLDAADLAAGGSVIGSTGTDTLIVKGTAFNLSSTGLTSIEILQAGSSLATTFTLDQADLASGGTIVGTGGVDTVVSKGTGLDLTSTTLNSIEILKAGVNTPTTFIVDAVDLVAGGSVIGSNGSDTLTVSGINVDLTSTTLTSIERLAAGASLDTTFTVNQADLAANGSVVGSGSTFGTDTLIVTGTSFDVSGTTLTSVEILKASSSLATTFIVDAGDLAAGGSVLGSSGTDTLVFKGTGFDLSSTDASSIEILKAGTSAATTITVNQGDLAANGSILGSTGSDTVAAGGTALNLTSTTLTSIEKIAAGTSSATTFTVDAADLVSGGSVIGSSGSDTLTVNATTINLTSTTLTSIESLNAGTSLATTFTVDQSDLAAGGSVVGSSGTDTLIGKGSELNLANTTLTSIEKLQGTLAATTFTLDNNDLAAGGSVLGGSGQDIVAAGGTELDLTSTTLSSIEVLRAANAGTAFTVDAADLVAGGSVLGGAGVDALIMNGSAFDVSSSTLSSVDVLQAGLSTATTFTVDLADLANGGSVVGSSGIDTLMVNGTAFDLNSTTLTSVEVLQAGSSLGTTFTLDTDDLASDGSIVGGAGVDTLLAGGTELDLSSTSLSSIEVLQASTSLATTFTVDQADLAQVSIQGSSGDDTLVAAGTELDLTSTSLTSIEILQAGSSLATTFTVDPADLAAGGSVVGSSGDDTLAMKTTAFDLTSTSLTSIEILQAGLSIATTFTLDADDLAAGGSVVGSSGSDTLTVKGTAFDLGGTSLTSIETLLAGSSLATTFTLDQADLDAGVTSVQGSSGTDTIVAAGSGLDLTSTSLSSIEILQAGLSTATTFTVDAADLAAGGSVVGSSGDDTLVLNTSAFDLTSTSLTSIEILQAGLSTATTFTLDAADLAAGGSVVGSSGTDTLIVKGTAFDLSGTSLASIETLKAGSSLATTFTLDQADLDAGVATIQGSSGSDTIVAAGSALDLTSTALTSIEKLQAGLSTATTFTVDAADLAAGGSVVGSSGDDMLVLKTTAFDLTSTSLSSIEILQAGSSLATTFTVDAADLASGGSVVGSSGSDTLTVKGTAFDLSSTSLSSIETLKSGSSLATTFTLDQADLDAGVATIQGSSGSDAIVAAGTALDLTSTALTSIETLQAGSSLATTFTVDAADLAAGGSVVGSSGSDTLTVKGTAFDLSSTSLTSIETLLGGSSLATTFTLDQADLDSGVATIQGSSGTDTLVAAGTALDLTSTSLTSIEKLQAGSSLATAFTVDAADLVAGGSVIGSAGSDSLTVLGTAFDLTSTSLTSIETLQAGSSLATTFTLDAADLAAGGSVVGSSGNDTLALKTTAFDLTSTSLSSIEILQASSSLATTFTVDAADLASGGSVLGSSGSDTLTVKGTAFDLTSTSLTSVERLQAGSSLATTFTVDQSDLASGGSVAGSSGTDTLVAAGSGLDLTSTTLSSIEILQAGSSLATTFTVDAADLASGGSVVGSSGNDTLVLKTTAFDLTSTSLTSIEILQAGTSLATTFTLDAADLAAGGSVVGSSGSDTLTVKGTVFDLSSTSLTSIETLLAGSSLGTTFILDQADLDSGAASVQGASGTDAIVAAGTGLDLTSTALTSIEKLQAGTSLATTFTVDAADLAAGGSVVGSSGSDTLTVKGTAFDLTGTSLSSIETLLAGSSLATTFTLDQADLDSGVATIQGSSGSDTIVAAGTALDLTSATLTSIEKLQAGSSLATTFTVDAADLASGGSVGGSSGSDTLAVKGTAFDLTSTALTSIEKLQAGSSLATTFTLDVADLVSGGSVTGSSGNDTLVLKTTAFDLTSTSLSSIEILQAGSSLATTFTVDAADLAAGGSVIGSSGSDTLTVKGTAFDLSSTSLSSIETLKTASSLATTFTLDQADLDAGVASRQGSSGSDTLVAAGTGLDLTSTALTSIEKLQAGSSLATTFTVDAADLVSGGSVAGSTGNDTLIIKGTAFDLSSTSLTSIEKLQAGSSLATTFTVDAADLASGGSVVGSSGNDTLTVKGTAFDLGSTSLSSIEILQAGSSLATTFTLDQADLAAGGSILGSSGSDVLSAKSTDLDLTSTTLSSIETIRAGSSLATTFTVDLADLVSGGSVTGSSGVDSLVIKGTSADLTSTTLTSVEILRAGSSLATTFTVNPADLASGGSVVGSTGNDTLTIVSTAFDLSSTSLTSIEVLQAGTSLATTFTLDQADLAAGGTVAGSSGSDSLVSKGTAIDLTSTTLTSIESLKVGSSLATTFTVDQADLASGLSVVGSSGNDTLVAGGAALDLTSTVLSSIEILKAGLSTATTFTVDTADLASNGSVIGSSGNDSLVIKSTAFDLSSTTLTSVEILQAGLNSATTFTLDQADLASGGSVVGSTGSDIIVANGTGLDLSSTALTSIETLKAGLSLATTFVVDQADLASSGTVSGSTGNDTLSAAGSDLNLSSTTLSSIEILAAASTVATTFTVDQSDLAASGTVTGNSGNDTLKAFGTTLDLTSTTVSSIEILQAGSASATTFTVDQADLASGGSVIGSSGSDILLAGGTGLDLSSTSLTSIEKLQAGLSIATTFTVDQADLASSGSVIGSTGNDSLAIKGTSLDLTSTALTSIEVLKAASSLATTFTVDAADLASGGSVIGSTGNDTLTLKTTAFDLSSTTLTSVEILQAGLSTATTFTVDQADLIGGGSVVGSSSSDILLAVGTTLDLSATTLSSIETLKAGSASATTFTLDQADLASNGSVTGSTGSDIIAANGTDLNLSSTTLTSIETLKTASSLATTFTVDQADLASAGSVTGSTGNDTLAAAGTGLDVTSTSLTSVEILKAASSVATTFTVDAADLASGGSVVGSSGNDTLTMKTTAFDVSSTTLSSIEILKAALSTATTFTVDQADLAAGGSVTGSSGNDTVAAFGTVLDLSSTTLSSIEILKAGTSLATIFTVDSSDLIATGSVTGSTGNDILVAAGTALDLSSTTLTSIEVLQAGSSLATTFTVDAADLASGGSVNGSTGNDVLIMKTTAFTLSSTTLTSVEVLQAGLSTATTFTIDQADLISGGSVTGSSGSDILTAVGTTLDLSSTALTSIETLKAGSSLATVFTVDQADLVASASVTGSSGNDTLAAAGTGLDLSSTTLSSIEILKAGSSLGTTFTVDAADLVSGGSVNGSTGNDTLVMKTTAYDLTSTTLTSIEVLQAGLSTATTFTVDPADLVAGGSVIGSSGSDILSIKGTTFDTSSTTLTSIENLKAQSSLATVFVVDQADLASAGSVTGSSGNDTLTIAGTGLDLTSVTLTSIEILKAGNSLATTFTVDQTDLIATGSVTGSTGNDVLAIAGTSLDLTSTTLTSVEILKAGSASATTFTLDTTDLASGGSVIGSSGSDTLSVKSTAFDLSSTALSSIEILKAALSTATTFTVDQADLLSGGSVTGSSGNDTLASVGTVLDLSSTTLSSIEILKTNSSLATTFTLDTADLASGGTVTGSSGNDTLAAGSTAIDLTSTTLSSIEILTAGSSLATTFTVDAADLAASGTVAGSTGVDTLALKTTAYDLTSTTLTSIEVLKAGLTLATTFTLNQADLASGGSITGTTQTDIVTISGSSLDLTSTTLVSIENLKAGLSTATTFTVDQADLVSGGSVTGSSGSDILVIKDNTLDLTSTTLSSVELLKAGSSLATTFIVDAADLLSGGSVSGSSGVDTLTLKTTAFDLTSTTLSSLEVLQAGMSTATTFTVDQADLASGGSVIGSSGLDSLVIKSAAFDLSSTTLSSVEILQAGLSIATVFTVDQSDLAAAGTVAGSSGTDTLLANGASLDLSSTTLSSIEAIRAGVGTATTFIVDAADLASGGSVFGSSGSDTLTMKGTSFDLTSTTLSSIEILQAGSSLATTFSVDTTDLLSGGSVLGSTGVDTLVIQGTTFDLTSSTLGSVEVLRAASSLATTFTVDQTDLLAGGSVVGSTGSDTLIVNGTTFDLSSTTLSSIEILQDGSASPTTFIVDQADIASVSSVIGSTGVDTLSAFGTVLNLTSTTLSSIETLSAASTLATTFTIDQADLSAGGSVIGNIGSDTLSIAAATLDLTSTTLTSVEILRAGLSTGTIFTVNQADLLPNGSVIGSSGSDSLAISGTALDLSSSSLSSIEILRAASSLATTFTVDQVDLAAGGSIIGSSGSDVLIVNGNSIDLSNTTLTSIETIKTSAPSGASTFTVGGGIGGASIDFTANGVIDTVALASGYKVADVTNDASILSHSVALNSFADGVGGDVIDLSAITNGTPSSSLDITGYISLASPATLKDALNLAAAGNGSSTAAVVTFQYSGNTYVLVDNTAGNTLGTDDVVVKLTGTHTLSDPANFTF